MSVLNELIRSNHKYARRIWGRIPNLTTRALEELTRRYRLSVVLGDIRYFGDSWYVTHAGLLRLAKRTRCSSIRVEALPEFCDASLGRWIFKATVYRRRGSHGFSGFGDANPSNVSPLVRGAEMRVAETRAVNRALRKAYGIGLCSVEELGWEPRSCGTPAPPEILCQQRRPPEWSHLPPQPPLPSDPSISTRCQSRQSLCRRFLWYSQPAGCHARGDRRIHY